MKQIIINGVTYIEVPEVYFGSCQECAAENNDLLCSQLRQNVNISASCEARFIIFKVKK